MHIYIYIHAYIHILYIIITMTILPQIRLLIIVMIIAHLAIADFFEGHKDERLKNNIRTALCMVQEIVYEHAFNLHENT